MTPEAYFSSELERLRQQWEAGRLDALLDALALCSDAWPLPEWAALGAVNGLRLAAAGYPLPDTTKGRAGGAVSRIAQDDVHLRRWELATWALGEATPDLDASERKEARRQIAMTFGREKGTRPEAFQIVSEILRGTPAQGGADAIEASYKKVKRELQSGEAHRFRVGNSPN